ILDSGVDSDHEDLAFWENDDESAGDGNEDGCPGVCGLDDDGDAWEDAESDTTDGIDNDYDGLIDETGIDFRDEQVMLADYDDDGVNLAGPDGEVGTGDDDSDDWVLAKKDDDENGYADDLVGWDFISEDNDPDVDGGVDWHGTSVAGPCCARTSNGCGIAGVAGGWNTSQGSGIMNLRCSTDTNPARRAVQYATEKGASVINMSWGTGSDVFLKEALDDAYDRGIVLVAATRENRYPAGWENVIGVEISNWHDWGPDECWATLYAPANDDDTQSESYVMTTYVYDLGTLRCGSSLGDDYMHERRGSSFAAPQVSGAAALLLAQDRDLTPAEICTLLVRGADNIGVATSCRNRIKWRLNVRGALDELCSWVDPYESDVSTDPSPEDTCVVLCPAGDLDTLFVDITVKDRCGQPMAGIPADSIRVSLLRNITHDFRLCCGDSEWEFNASSPTDSVGFTSAIIARGAGSDPHIRIRVTVRGVELADKPWVNLRSVAYGGVCSVPEPDPGEVPDLDCDGAAGDYDDIALVTAHVGHTCPGRGGGGESDGAEEFPEQCDLSYELHQNAPNPFSRATTIAWELPEKLRIRVLIYDATGRLVKTLVDADLLAGRHAVRWDGTDDSGAKAASGSYFCEMRSVAGIQRTKLMLLQ
ncbi:S8 family serine peptidase, partial [bacterium]|nr:S8 family serine peptidase [bacterium]